MTRTVAAPDAPAAVILIAVILAAAVMASAPLRAQRVPAEFAARIGFGQAFGGDLWAVYSINDDVEVSPATVGGLAREVAAAEFPYKRVALVKFTSDHCYILVKENGKVETFDLAVDPKTKKLVNPADILFIYQYLSYSVRLDDLMNDFTKNLGEARRKYRDSFFSIFAVIKSVGVADINNPSDNSVTQRRYIELEKPKPSGPAVRFLIGGHNPDGAEELVPGALVVLEGRFLSFDKGLFYIDGEGGAIDAFTEEQLKGHDLDALFPGRRK